MLVRVLRRSTPEEIEDRIKRFEQLYDMSFDEFEELSLTRKTASWPIDEYFEWADLEHAYRGYVESGELDYVVEEIYDLSFNELRALTSKRLELLHALSGLSVESINELARKVHRDVKNVYQDLRVLNKLGLVNLKKRKRNVIPEALVEEITFITR